MCLLTLKGRFDEEPVRAHGLGFSVAVLWDIYIYTCISWGRTTVEFAVDSVGSYNPGEEIGALG